MTINERLTNVSDYNLHCHDDITSGGGLIGLGVVLAVSIAAGPIQQASVIPVEHRAFAACVSDRESHGNYRARGDESSARGRWQFLDTKWRRGLSFMVADRLVKFGMPRVDARNIRKQMVAKSIDKWTPVLQDVAFVAVVTGPAGSKPWYLAGSRCNRLAAS